MPTLRPTTFPCMYLFVFNTPQLLLCLPAANISLRFTAR